MGKNKNLRRAWIDESLAHELDRLASRLKDELGEGKKVTASRLLAQGIRKTKLIERMEFAHIPEKMARKKGRLDRFFEMDEDNKWGWRI